MLFSVRTTRLSLIALGLAGSIALSGCAAIAVGGVAATTATVATDRRTAGEQVDDQTIEMKAGAEARKLVGEQDARINTNSYAGHLLLVGDVPTEEMRQQVESNVGKIPKVRKVYNHLRVGDVTSLSVRSNDSWITTKVRTALINTKEVPSRTISVTTERGVVYLQGKVTTTEGERAALAAAGVEGVNKVVKLFEYVSPASVQQEQNQNSSTVSNTGNNTSPPPASSSLDNGPEAIPVQ
ncbi:BON domain-containing protein [Paenalcaligenes suwonensis]|uniref:BON domain-containing protein n=1 Tax=Paenalcaligenes suwonensis TaxID=1202713 RepID=UPI001408F0DE|nr:BON domain-containing protein [Paenalcaligenes suwonensis]NHC60842.1 BON domain-containing protein [Paenalcaligenes suwonensis]